MKDHNNPSFMFMDEQAIRVHLKGEVKFLLLEIEYTCSLRPSLGLESWSFISCLVFELCPSVM